MTYVDVTIEPDKGALALEQCLSGNDIDVILYNWNSSVSLALMDVAAKYKVPYFFGLGAADTIVEKWKEDPEGMSYYMCKGWPNSTNLSNSYWKFLDSLMEDGSFAPRNQKFALICDDTAFGRAIGENIRNQCLERGWEVPVEEYVSTSTTDMYPYLTKVKESDASIVLGSFTNPASNAGYLKQAQELSINALLFCDCFTEAGDWYEKAGEASDYTLDSRPKFTKEGALAFVDAFEKKYGYTPAPAAGGQVYDYSHFFYQIIEECEKAEGAVNAETLYKYGNEVVMKGGLEFTDSILQDKIVYEEGELDPVVGEGYYIYPIVQLVNGETQIVWPESMKEADVVVPDYAK